MTIVEGILFIVVCVWVYKRVGLKLSQKVNQWIKEFREWKI